MRLVRTAEGIARLEGDELLVLDLPHPDVAALLADVDRRPASARVKARRALASAQVLSPLIAPSQFVVVGFNDRTHVAEIGVATPTEPAFAVLPGGPGITAGWNAAIRLPREAPDNVDYEGELGVVIGRTAHGVAARDAWGFVGGLTVVNDVSARDVQRRAMSGTAPELRLGKLFETFKPCGPAVVTPDDLPIDALDLQICTRVNGETRQTGRTGDFIFAIPELIEAITRVTTLRAGDLICTGTPGGVGAAAGRFLKEGDVVEVEIDGLGRLRNRVATSDE